jgi:hydrogenase maturation protease
MTKPVMIIGAGNLMCGDDALGPEAVARLAEALGDSVRAETNDRNLWDVVDGTDRPELLVLVDAAAPSAALPAGQWCRIDYPADAHRLDEHGFRDTHSLNLCSTLELAKGLGTLPENVWIYGMAGATFARGYPLSTLVQQRLPALVSRIEIDVRTWLEQKLCTNSP